MKKLLLQKIEEYEAKQIECLDKMMYGIYNYSYNYKYSYEYAGLKLIYDWLEVKIQICKYFVK